MKYRSHFTLLQPQGKQQHYAVTFPVDDFESPGHTLRRIVFAQFENSGAIGLSMEIAEPLYYQSTSQQSTRGQDQISIMELPDNAPKSHRLKELNRAY